MKDMPSILQAISGVSDPDAIRIVVFINGQMVHAPLSTVLDLALDGVGDYFQPGTTIDDDALLFADPADGTKRVRLDAGGITAGQTRVLAAPDASGTIALTSDLDGRLRVDAAQSFTVAQQKQGQDNLGALGRSLDAKSAAYTVVAGDNGKALTVDASGGARTITLPAAASAGNGFKIIVKKSDSSANAVTVDADGAETIDGATTKVLRLQHQSVALVCDGTAWRVLSEGAVFARGTGSNGEYVRFADGTQHCTKAGVTVTASSTSVAVFAWTLPAAFTDTNYVTSICVTNPGNFTGSKRRGFPYCPTKTTTATEVGFVGEGVYVVAETLTADVITTGRWF